MRVLGIATATEGAGVALVEGGKVLWESTWRGEGVSGYGSEKIPELAEQLVRTYGLPEGLGGIAVTKGPGGYTGLRVGLTFAKGLAEAWRVPIVGLSTMDCLSAQVTKGEGALLTLLYACREDWNVALYSGEIGLPSQRLSPDFVMGKKALLTFLRSVQGPLTILSSPFHDWLAEIRAKHPATRVRLLAANFSEMVPRHVACLGAYYIEEGRRDDPLSLQAVYSHLPNVTTPRTPLFEGMR